MEIVSQSLSDTEKFAESLLSLLPSQGDNATVIGLYGNLGSGKTTFMKFFAKKLLVKEVIQSPTFVIMKSFDIDYKGFKKLIHIDAYRLESTKELENLGWKELIEDKSNIICIEWPEKVAEVMPSHIMLRFEYVEGSEERKISLA